ncbi:YceD family protein [Desulfosediminicola flagellatus]|uniref:YceD family protein n=1 Tax=Desulfosediminicola flagellatus TaxID=2569541 RepID=UPI0010AC824E|nr:DUF177 domain-containing protein [Desulfosediminicola flagellatus]
MKIAFGEIGRKITRLSIQDTSWLPSEIAPLSSSVTAEISCRQSSENMVVLEGLLAGRFRLDCARCGDQVDVKLEENFQYLVTTQKEEISDLQEKECSDEECDTLYLKEPVIDVVDILQEQLYLAIPGKVLCDEQCKGLCLNCGKSKNRNECTCDGVLPDSPFAALKKLKKD